MTLAWKDVMTSTKRRGGAQFINGPTDQGRFNLGIKI
jgi:hypothetical protein